MTYISRRTRIIVSRLTDECDANYILRAVRKRSDGRFKRHGSCDDLRAWVNDYCIKHEYLVDLMSDGEFSEGPPFRLYGRFIPVPILLKLMQSLQNNEAVSRKHKDVVGKSASDKCTCMGSSDFLNENENSTLDRSASLSRVQWEKNHLEKSFYDSSNLLSQALRTLERIRNIVDLAKEEYENERNEEIQLAFSEAQAVCECNPSADRQDSSISDSLHSSQSYVKKMQYSRRCTELLRKISGLREKLKKVQECRQLITRQIDMTQAREAECEPSNQVTELYSFREQSQIKRLKKKLEKLISEKGRLLCEMCDALNSLNNLKKSSRLNLRQKKSSKSSPSGDVFKCGLRESASCVCGCNCSRASSEFDKFNSDSPSGESYCKECTNNFKRKDPCDTFSASTKNISITPLKTACSGKSRSSDTVRGDDDGFAPLHYCKEFTRNSSQSKRNAVKPCVTYPQNFERPQTASRLQKFMKDTKKQNTSYDVKKETEETKRSSKINFADENESPCRKRYYQDDLIAFEKSLTPEQQAVIQKALKKIENRRSHLISTQETQKRPTSSPTTRRERNSVFLEHHCNERQAKSETTMQEIEKTLRNYEQRLRNYDTLEYKVEEIRQKISEANQMKREWAKQKEKGQRVVEAEREKSCKEITKLTSENRKLKKQMEQLMAKFETQCKKIQSLKNAAQKNWELESETEELKKELLKYQNTLERQRKCITKWESVVSLQRKEIENLMNHIRRLTTANNCFEEYQFPERKNIQRSRSYIAEITNFKKVIGRPKTHATAYRLSSEEECVPYCCEEFEQMKNNKRSQQSHFDSGYYSPLPSRKMKW